MFLAGRSDVQLASVKVGGKALSEADYERTDKKLVIKNLPEGSFELEIETVIKPQASPTFGRYLDIPVWLESQNFGG